MHSTRTRDLSLYFDPETPQLCVAIVQFQAILSQVPSLVQHLLSIMLQGKAQEDLSQAWPARASVHTQQCLLQMQLQSLREVMQSGLLSGAEQQAAAAAAQVLRPHRSLLAAVRTVGANDLV